MKSFDRNVDGFYDVENQLPRYLRKRATEQFEAARETRAGLDDVASFEAHRDRVRDHFLDALGGLPDAECTLNPERTGVLERDGYAIETVVFESLPGFHVTANVYLPAAARPDGDDAERDEDDAGSGSFPGVLFLCGHSAVGKAAGVYQQVCVDLARNGFVVLAVDPIGQGERHQFYDPDTGECARENTWEHTYLNQQCAFAGGNVARYFVHDGMRALDYLVARPEVDPDRLGATGNSGGGTQTGYLLLADERIDAAVPCCFVTSKEDYMETGQAQDGEQILYRAIDRGPRYDDFLSAFAPNPLLVGSARSDFLCLEGAERTLERTRHVYELYDAGDALDHAVADETHGFSPYLREATVNWFLTHLTDQSADFETGDPPTEDPERLHCTAEGEVLAAYPEETTVTDLLRRHVRRTTPNAGSAPNVDDHDAYAREVRAALRERFDLDGKRCDRYPRHYDAETVDGITWEKTFFFAERDPPVVVTAVVARDADGTDDDRDPLVLLYDRGTDAVPERRTEIADRVTDHGTVAAFDPRGVGAVRARDVNTPLMNGGEYQDYHGTEDKLASDAVMLGTSLVALRTRDVLQACAYLRERAPGDDGSVAVEGHGPRAVLATYAAVADSSIRSVRLVDPIDSFYDRATAREMTLDLGQTVHDVVGRFDLPQLLPALADREVSWVGADPADYR